MLVLCNPVLTYSHIQQLSAIHSLASTYKFTIDIRSALWYGCACYLEQTRHPATTLTRLDSALRRNLAICTIFVQITPSESTLAKVYQNKQL
jgi:hypothetical protein